MKNITKKAEKQHMINQFIEAWRLVFQQAHESIELLGVHKRRKRAKFMVDGKLTMVILGQHPNEELPDEAWLDPREDETAMEFADMFGVN